MDAQFWRSAAVALTLTVLSLNIFGCGDDDDDDDAPGTESSALVVYPETPGAAESNPVPAGSPDAATNGGGDNPSNAQQRRGGCGMTRDGSCPMCDGDG